MPPLTERHWCDDYLNLGCYEANTHDYDFLGVSSNYHFMIDGHNSLGFDDDLLSLSSKNVPTILENVVAHDNGFDTDSDPLVNNFVTQR